LVLTNVSVTPAPLCDAPRSLGMLHLGRRKTTGSDPTLRVSNRMDVHLQHLHVPF
jgi:hypothetical protein